MLVRSTANAGSLIYATATALHPKSLPINCNFCQFQKPGARVVNRFGGHILKPNLVNGTAKLETHRPFNVRARLRHRTQLQLPIRLPFQGQGQGRQI